MKTFSADEICKMVNGKLIQGSPNLTVDTAVSYVEKISKPNMLLFLRTTKNMDFETIMKNVPCVVVTDKEAPSLKTITDCTVILVDNIELSFWAFVYYYRNCFRLPVIAVTGTCGKSTTKDMIMHVLRHGFNVEGTDVSANSRTHNLSYLVRIDENTDAAVFETAVGKPGDITTSCKYFKPTIGIITNISEDHLEGCKTMENYIKAKGEMLSGVSPGGVIIINSDDENIKKLNLNNFNGQIVRFGIDNAADFKASNVQYTENGMDFILSLHHMKYKIFIPGYGIHQVYNALAALAALHELGVGIAEAAESLQSFKNLPYHIQVDPGINGSVIIDDTWNTNPSSLKAALEVLNNISRNRKRIAVIGDINALGELTLEVHQKVGHIISEMERIDILVTIGPMAEVASKEAITCGFKGEVHNYPDVNGLYDFLKDKLDSNTTLLIKSAGYHDKTILDLAKKLRE